MRSFASINDQYICTGIQQSERDVAGLNIIEITAEVESGTTQADFFWRKYENGAWSADKFPPAPPVPGPDLLAEINQLKSQNADLILAMVMNNLM